MENSNLIQLDEHSSSEIGYDSLRNIIISRFGRRLFEFRSMKEIVYEVLRIIDKTSGVLLEDNSIQENVLIVLKHFKLENGKLFLTREAMKRIKTSKTNISNVSELDIFYCFILGFDKLPKLQLRKIQKEVEKDLREINELITHYESLEVIQKLMKGEEVHRSNNAIIHLYGRCLKERQVMFDYFFKGMYNRAFQMSKYGMDEGTKFYMAHTFNFKPYSYNQESFETNYDYQNIECCWHRMHSSNECFGDTAIELANIYKEDKNLFYNRFFELEPIENIFQRIESYLSILPLKEQRREIIIESKRLFIAEEWLAFYAIILPQVEGLFSEMCEASQAKGRTDSLPKKVRAIRDHSYDNEIMLDYYEYILPDQRNQFAHGGLPENPKILAFDMLTDLENVLYLYSELNNPLVIVNRFVSRRSQTDFPDYTIYSVFFNLVNNLKPNDRNQIATKINSFNLEFLISNQDIIKEQLKSSFKGYFDQKELIVAELQKKGFPALGTVDKMDKAINFDIHFIAGLYFDSFTALSNAYLLNTFFHELKKYCKTYKVKDFLTEEFGIWETEKKSLRNINQLTEYFDSQTRDE